MSFRESMVASLTFECFSIEHLCKDHALGVFEVFKLRFLSNDATIGIRISLCSVN